MSGKADSPPPLLVLEETILDFDGLADGVFRSAHKEVLTGYLVFNLVHSKRKVAASETYDFGIYLECRPKRQSIMNEKDVGWGQYDVEFDLQILRCDGGPSFSRNVKYGFCKGKENIGCRAFLDIETLLYPANKYVVHNQLKYTSRIYSISPSNVSSDELKVLSDPVTPTSLLDTFLASAIGADVCFMGRDDEKVLAHAGILVAVSPVFKTMFEAPMLETTTREVHLDDMTSALSLLTFLRCVYTGSLSHLYGIPLTVVKDVINAAERYELKASKKGAGMFLPGHCSPKNELELLHFAKRYGLQGPELAAREFIRSNVASVMDNTVPVEGNPE